VPIAGVGVAIWALERLGFARIGHALLSINVPWALLGLLLMCTSLLFRAESWYAVLRAAGTRARRWVAVRGVMIGVLMSAALPGRLGEPARAFIVSRRLGNTRRWFATVAGTVFAQTLINIVALGLLAAGALAGPGLLNRHAFAIVVALGVPLLIAGAIVIAPPLLRKLGSSRIAFVRKAGGFAAAQMASLRRGLFVFRRPGAGIHATLAQLTAWGLQWMACYMLIRAYGLDHGSGLAAAAGVLLAVNVTAAVPVTPSNVGIFQAACIRRRQDAGARLRHRAPGARGGDGRAARRARLGERGSVVEHAARDDGRAGAGRGPRRVARRPQARVASARPFS
jgi:phosphatidylinositol alpha-mannosyltransferase